MDQTNPQATTPQNLANNPDELVGILGYVGTTGVGKTHLAKEHLKLIHKKGIPCLIIDAATVANFDDIPHVETPADVCAELWGKKDHQITAWTPKQNDIEEFDSMMRAIQSARADTGTAVLVDEITFWKKSKELPYLYRTWRHSKTTILVTSQHVSADMGQVLFGCNPRVFIFRTTAPRSVEFYMRWYGLDPDHIRQLPDRQFIEKRF